MLYRPPTAAIERHALEVAAEYERKIGPFRAEIVPDATPAWHVVRTAPGRENTAAEHLERRCVGVFLPRFIAGSRMTLSLHRPDNGPAAPRAGRPIGPADPSLQSPRFCLGCAGALAADQSLPRRSIDYV